MLDEATAMLDPAGRREVIDTVLRLNREQGITVVLITHHMVEAERADRVIVMNDGEVAMDGTPRQVFSQVERLHELGLAAPDTVELLYRLRRECTVKSGTLEPDGSSDCGCGENGGTMYRLRRGIVRTGTGETQEYRASADRTVPGIPHRSAVGSDGGTDHGRGNQLY